MRNMQVEINIPRPMTALLAIAAVSGWVLYLQNPKAPATADVTPPPVVVADAKGGEEAPPSLPTPPTETGAVETAPIREGDPALNRRIADAERKALEARAAQQLLLEREEVLRYELDVLKTQRANMGQNIDPELEEQFRNSTRLLLTLLQDEKKAEQFLLSSLNQIWEADGRAIALGKGVFTKDSNIILTWPVVPSEGLSAQFLDTSYEDRFKFKHYGIDIPADQGTAVRAAASGIVKDVVDHGLGFSYVTIEHPGGYATLYGHLSHLTAQPGQFIAAGDVIGLSGGLPGTAGAGFSTGPHLHFGLYVAGEAVDPTSHLPSL